MATRNLQLRLKTKSGQYLVDSLNQNENTVGELKAVIWSVTKLHPDQCRILIGFPPEELFLVDDEQLIGEIIKNPRETLILEESVDNQNQASSRVMEPQAPPRRTMRRIEVPANNSCLFVSVNYAITGKMHNRCPQLRETIAETVKNDPVTFNEGFLGKPNSEYCTWIRNEDHWGGGIELSILSKFYSCEICAVDTQHVRLNRFGEDQNFPYRIFLIFDGIHYDPLIVESTDINNPIQTKFTSDDVEVIDMALAYASEAKEKHQYTDLKRMMLRCNECHATFQLSESAREHAAKTQHLDFSEFSN